jgi:nicotinamidase-related amidase
MADRQAPTILGFDPLGPSRHPDAQSYAQAGFGHRIGWGSRPALLLVDVCRAFWMPSPLYIGNWEHSQIALGTIQGLVSRARLSNVPVIWATLKYTSMDEAGLWFSKAKMLDIFQEGDARQLGEWWPFLEPRPDEIVVRKRFPSAFFETELRDRLTELRVDTLIVCGASTSGSVRATSLDAMCHGFRPMVVGDACVDRSEAVQKANLFDLDAKYADVIQSVEAEEKLRNGWQ